jgi:transcription elongation factor GreA
MLKNVKLIDDDEINTESVNVGSKVTVLDVEFNEEMAYLIVGSTEADPDENRISDESPVGTALLNHRVGETVMADTPSGSIELKILAIAK